MAHSFRDFQGKWIEREVRFAATNEQRIFTLRADGTATSEGYVFADSTEVIRVEEQCPLPSHQVCIDADGRLGREGFALVRADTMSIQWKRNPSERNASDAFVVYWSRYQEWKEFVLTVSASIDQGTGIRVVCTSMGGKTVATSILPTNATWREARLSMARQLQPYLTRKLRFVLPSGRLLSRADDARAMSEVCELGVLAALPIEADDLADLDLVDPAEPAKEKRTRLSQDGQALAAQRGKLAPPDGLEEGHRRLLEGQIRQLRAEVRALRAPAAVAHRQSVQLLQRARAVLAKRRAALGDKEAQLARLSAGIAADRASLACAEREVRALQAEVAEAARAALPGGALELGQDVLDDYPGLKLYAAEQADEWEAFCARLRGLTVALPPTAGRGDEDMAQAPAGNGRVASDQPVAFATAARRQGAPKREPEAPAGFTREELERLFAAAQQQGDAGAPGAEEPDEGALERLRQRFLALAADISEAKRPRRG